MNGRVVRVGLNSLLLVAVIAGSNISPAVRHRHEGFVHPLASHSHHHSHHSHDHSHQKSSTKTFGDVPVWHIHLSLFGWDLTWSSGDDSNESFPDGERFGNPVEYLVRLNNVDTISGAVQTVQWLEFALPSFTGRLSVGLHTNTHVIAANCPISSPLCDTARGERSGVQLI